VALPEVHSAGTSQQAGGSGQKAASASRATTEIVHGRKVDASTDLKVLVLPEFHFAGTSKQADGSEQKAASGSRATAEVVNRLMIDSDTDPKAKIERIQRKPEKNALTCFNEMLHVHSKDTPSNLVVKDSWPLVGRNNEKAMYDAARGLFGVPEVLASYQVKGFDGNSHLTKRFLPAHRKYWNIWNFGQYPAHAEAATDPEPEERVQIRHLFKTEGRDLLDATSPHELLEGVLHVMIGVSYVGLSSSLITDDTMSKVI
jgi:hypothetical protein